MINSQYYPGRRFRSSEVPGFDANYYLSKNPDVGANYKSWASDLSSLHYADYVRASPDLNTAWEGERAANPAAVLGRWSWGAQHWDRHGHGEGGRIRPLVIGPATTPQETRTVWTGASIPDKQEEADFAAWHYDTFGQHEGRFKSEHDWYNSPEQMQERQNKFQEELMARQEAYQAEQLRIQEEAAAKAARVKGSSPTGVGGAASIKGSRLSITEAGGRKGTQRFSRPTEFMNTLGIGSATPSTGKSTLNL